MTGRDEAEQALAALGAGHDRIAMAMYAIDVHPALRLLRGGTHSGATAARWRALAPEIDLLWAQFAVLGQVLDSARQILRARRLSDADQAALTRLLRQPVVPLDATGLPVGDPAAIGSPVPTGVAVDRLTLAQLATGLEQRTAVVADHLSEVDSAWSAVAGPATALAERVQAAAALADGFGEDQIARRLRDGQAEVDRLDLGDPLTAAPHGTLSAATASRLSTLETELGEANRRLAGLAAWRDEYPQRAEALRALVEQVAAGEAELAAAQANVAEKIAGAGQQPAGGAPGGAAAVLRARLSTMDATYRDARRGEPGAWKRLADDAATLEESARVASARCADRVRLANGLIERRDELRGRLSAYRAKAAASGFAEHPGLTELAARARALLYTAPCDLRASTRAVHAYQQALADALAGKDKGESP